MNSESWPLRGRAPCVPMLSAMLALLVAPICAAATLQADVPPTAAGSASIAAMSPDAARSDALAAVPDAASCQCAPAGTPVVIEVLDMLVSDVQKAGDGFALTLAEPVVVDDIVLVPAGTPGRGEIVHAAKARGGGRPGELLLAARYLEHDGRRIPLRGMKLGAAGKDNTGVALATAIGIGVFAHFIHGGEMRIPPGTRAQAKLAASVNAATAPPVPTGESRVSGGFGAAPTPTDPTVPSTQE